MRSKIVTIAILISTLQLHAQNYGFGTSNPLARVHIAGNLFINQSFNKTVLNPTAAQTKTMINANTIGFAETDSTGRIYDPSGPRNPLFYRPYAQNIKAYAFIPPGSQYGSYAMEITVEWGGLGDGDSIFIVGDPDMDIRIGSGWVAPRTFLMGGGSAYITFVSNNDLSVGEGFSIMFRRLYDQPLSIPQNIFGNQLFYDANKGAIQTGYINQNFFLQGLGLNSAAFGYLSNAGEYSLAAGYKNNVSGSASFGAGFNNKAINKYTASWGFENTASGNSSTAFGAHNTASGVLSLATGQSTVASGYGSVTMGYGTQSQSFACVSMGRWNYTAPTSKSDWFPFDPVLLVGNGTGPDARSNMLEYYKNGTLIIWGSLWQFSDEKLKKDIKPLSNSLNRLAALKGYNYSWVSKELDDRMQTGMLAQEVEKTFPELVTKTLKGESAVNYEGLIPHLVEAIKELRQEVAALKGEKGTIAVCVCEGSSADKLAAFPNPVGEQLTVTIDAVDEGKGLLQLFDNNGKVIKQMSVMMQKGKNVFKMTLPGLASGQYELVATYGKGVRKQVSIVKP
jgi:hypothetical protein